MLMRSKLKRMSKFASSKFLAFRQDQSGAMWPFVAPLFMGMLSISFICIDVLQHETQRNALQQTLDRGTLAAATLTNKLSPTAVVNDYFAKAGISSSLTGVNVQTDNFGYRKVTAQAEGHTNAVILGTANSGKLKNTAVSSAEQRIGNVEIVLVLDVSGSMNSNMSGSSSLTKMASLKSAAVEFVNIVLDSSTDNRISIAIVPFNGQVNLGASLASKYTVTGSPGVADVNCIDLPASAYTTIGLSRTTALNATAHADTFSGVNAYSSWNTDERNPEAGNRWCPPSTTNTVMIPSISKTDLANKINGLSAIGATSINAGMKWGLTLMDPANTAMYNEFIASNQMSNKLAGRPFGFTYEDGMKVIVLMTDGSHFSEERVNTDYKQQTSPIWRGTSDSNVSIFHTSLVNSSTATTICNSRPFWVPHLNAFHSRPWNGTAPSSSTCYSATATYTGTTRQTWNQVWANYRLKWVAWQLYARGLSTNSSTQNTIYTNQVNLFRSLTATTTMDSQLQSICGLAKTNEVVVYGIAYEAPTAGKTQIQACASSNAHYFDAAGLQIRTAFRTIANNINQLRLVQ